MAYPPVIVLGYSEAAMLLKKPESADVQAIIAIHGQFEFPVESDAVSRILVLRFDDSEAQSATDPIEAARIRLRQREAAKSGRAPMPPTADDARSIIEFAESIRQMDGTLLCQCRAGISRSPAAALLCLATWTGPGRESECVGHLLSIRPSAVPHLDLVAFGDEELDRHGRLVEELRQRRP